MFNSYSRNVGKALISKLEYLKRFKVRDNIEIIMNRDDLRTDLNGRAERIRELEPSDLRNGLTNRP